MPKGKEGKELKTPILQWKSQQYILILMNDLVAKLHRTLGNN